MTKVRHPALWLAAAVAMIGVWLMPAVANAHAGHEPRAVEAAALAAGAASVVDHAAAASSSEFSDTRGACNSPCCGSAGHAHCCGCVAGLVPGAEASLLPPAAAARLPMGVRSGRAPIVPEALPEPPRHLA